MASHCRYRPIGRPLADRDLWGVVRLLHRLGPGPAARAIGIGRSAFLAAAAGAPIAYATELAIVDYLDRTVRHAA
jgi:hypothetical protein